MRILYFAWLKSKTGVGEEIVDPLRRDVELLATRLCRCRIDVGERSDVEDRPEQGAFAFVGSGLATVVVHGTRYTFRFDTSKIDRDATPIISGWWTTPAGTVRPSTLTVGEVTLKFNEAGELC